MKSISIALIVMLGLSACGRKGPLQPPPENSAKPADTQPADRANQHKSTPGAL